DGRTLLNHYDLTNKAEGDRVRVDVSADSTAAAEQVLSECGSATFKNMEACAYLLKREDFNPRRAFEKHRDKMESDSYGKPEEPLDQTISEEDAEKFLEIILQSPYGQDKTRDASEQGNLGRPVMGDPYGKVKDFDIQGKEHGRPFRAEPEIVLEAPLNPWGGFSVMSSGWDGAVTPQTLGGVRYQSFAKSSHWSYHPDPNIAGFRVYEKDPGELTFRVTREIFLANVTWHSSTYGRDGSTSFYVGDDGALVQVSAVFSGGIRAATDWPVGTYEAYVVAFDAEGKEGPRSVTCYATNLGEMQWLRPTEGQIIGTYYPKLEWSNIWPAEIRENGGWGWTELIVSDAASIYNHFHGYVVWPNTSQNVWRHLMSGHSYYAVLSGGGYAQINGVWHYYLAYSRLVGFSAQ
ncbi:MAG: hypothetical protein HY466_04825, partial [Deltaproteobacteria bacterium]|nr:hypothetical protein [Deltaproteobacteria bacterium]